MHGTRFRYDWDREAEPTVQAFCRGAIAGAVLQAVLVLLFLMVLP